VVKGEESGMTPLASLGGDFKDAFDFIFHERTGPGGARVGGAQLWSLIVTHLELSAAAVGIAIAVALPLGLWLGHTRRGSFVAITVANIGRAVPSIGLVFLFFAILGAGFVNIMFALVLLAIPPILTNTYTGMREVDREVVDAARGMGMGGVRIVRGVELPLALPLIFGGIRISTVNVIATATLGPFGGVVTLGDPIINPSSYGDAGRLGAAIVVAALAVAAEVGLSAVQRAVTPEGLKAGAREARRQARFIPKRRAQPAP
jgi:osmoprotectant transport system permease protein